VNGPIAGYASGLSAPVSPVEDAVLSAERGVDTIALSNRGGRQLDGARALRSRGPGG
jgi:hypothetical protein